LAEEGPGGRPRGMGIRKIREIPLAFMTTLRYSIRFPRFW
jgi:hypothetical protein